METKKQIEEKQLELIKLKENLKTEKATEAEVKKKESVEVAARLVREKEIIKQILLIIYAYNKVGKPSKINSDILVTLKSLLVTRLEQQKDAEVKENVVD